MRLPHALHLGAFTLALFAFIGCGGNNMVEVNGTVKYDGQPIDQGSINFSPLDGDKGTAGGVIKDGRYSVKVPVGMMKVAISWPRDTGKKKKAYDTPDSPEKAIFAESLPPEYSKMETTELKYDVKPGENKKDWDLKK